MCGSPMVYLSLTQEITGESKKYADTIVPMAFQSLIIYSQSRGLALCQNLKNWLLNQAEKFKRPKCCLLTFHIVSHLWQNVLIYFFEHKILLSVQNSGFGSFQHLLVESQKKYKRGGGEGIGRRDGGKEWGMDGGRKRKKNGGREGGRRREKVKF